ncbi:MAG: pilus assembly protein CpaE [Chloroflexi bacterium]|nr:pilus assembly protein CpaE [Chloroflexota bacterium]
MITLDLARRLRAAGIPWTPASGDRFMVPDRDMDDEVFMVSEMTVEAHDRPSGRVIRFNGTTEWALDSIEARDVVWLPREDQLRTLLGGRFVRLEVVPDGWAVTTEHGGRRHRHQDPDVERAYALSILAALTG